MRAGERLFVGLVLLLSAGDVNGLTLVVGAISITIIAIVGGYFFLRRESSARRLRSKLQRPLSRTLVKLKRNPIKDGITSAVLVDVGHYGRGRGGRFSEPPSSTTSLRCSS